jgi:polysaccharide biosynthesis/export protein
MGLFRAFRRCGALSCAAALAFSASAQTRVPGAVFGTPPNTAHPPSAVGAPGAAPAATVTTPTITNQQPRDAQQPFAPQHPPTSVPSTARITRSPVAAVQEPTGESVETNEFQEFVFTSVGRQLPLFGHNLFRGAPSTFAPVENIPVTPDYVIGPGDELLIRAWGQIDIDYRAIVDRNGTISLPRVGVIPVAGIRYQNLTAHIRSAVSRNFRNFELTVSMGTLRSVQIFVVGQASRPGSYTVSSLSTLVNAIFAAGGPSARGSMRNIQLKRGNYVIAELDLYDLIVTGYKSKDAPLLPGDVIYFPPIGSLVALSGSVNNPAIFELKGSTNVGRLLDLAGGLTTTAQTRRASIERIDDRQTRTVDQFSLDYDGLRRPVKDGDLVAILPISPRFENAVTLRGKVAVPLRYPHRPGMRIRDLVPDRDALITDNYYARKNIAVRAETVTQGQLSYDVRRLADEINWDYAVIERLNKNDLTTVLIPFNLGKAVLENDAGHNLLLTAGDIVTVFSKSDITAAAERRSVVVSLEGEFNFAGVYQAQPGETLRQLVIRVGGVTPQGYIFGAQFTRESTRREQEERLKQAVDQLEQDVQRAAVARSQNILSAEDAAGLKQQAESQHTLVARLRSLKPTGRIVFEMPENATPANLPDIALEDGDRLQIPKQPSTVNVFGTVFNESAFLYASDKSVGDYLALAGGPRPQAARSTMYVLRADGSIISSRRSLFSSGLAGVRVMPGDSIVVPEDFERTTLTKDLKDWTQILYQFGIGAAALKVLKD